MNRHGAASLTPPTDASQVRSVILVGPQGTGKSALIAQIATGHLGHHKDAEAASTELGVLTTVHPGTGTVLTLVDSPGRPDFVGDVRAGLRAADAVLVVVAAGSGIDEATRMLWRECEAVGIPRAVAVTQLELARSDWDAVVAQCSRVFGDAVPLGLPVLEGSPTALTGVLDLLEQVRHDASGEQHPLTEEQAALVEEHRGSLIEAIIETSEDEGLLDRYLSGEELDLEGLRADLSAAVATARFFPIVPVNPPTGVGVPALLDLMVGSFPAPDRAWMPAVMTPQGAAFPPLTADPDGPLVAQVIRTSTDPYVGRLSLLRIFSGTLTHDARLHVSGHLEWVVGHEVEDRPGHDEEDERVGQISTPLVGGTAPRPSAIAGAWRTPSLSSPLPALADHSRETLAEGTKSTSSAGSDARFSAAFSSLLNQPPTVLQPANASAQAITAAVRPAWRRQRRRATAGAKMGEFIRIRSPSCPASRRFGSA